MQAESASLPKRAFKDPLRATNEQIVCPSFRAAARRCLGAFRFLLQNIYCKQDSGVDLWPKEDDGPITPHAAAAGFGTASRGMNGRADAVRSRAPARDGRCNSMNCDAIALALALTHHHHHRTGSARSTTTKMTTAAPAAGPAVAVPNPALVNPRRLQGRAKLERQRTVVKRKAPPALKALAGSIGGLTEALFLQPVVRGWGRLEWVGWARNDSRHGRTPVLPVYVCMCVYVCMYVCM